MSKPDTSALAKQRQMGQDHPGNPAVEPEAETVVAVPEGEARVVLQVSENTHVLRELAPGEVVGDENVDLISVKMKQLIEAGIVTVDPETQHVNWPEGTPPIPKPADAVDVHTDAKPKPAPKAKSPKKKANKAASKTAAKAK